MDVHRVQEILAAIRGVRVAVYGDFCIDAYWTMDPRGSEVSVETGLPAAAVGAQRYSLGGAANVVANLAALQPAAIQTIGVVGDDIFGRELLRQLQCLQVDTGAMTVQREGFDTVTYCKRYREGNEEPRIDFGIYNRRAAATDEAILAALRRALESGGVLILNQQVPGSISDESFIVAVNRLLAEFADRIVLLDSRHYGGQFRHVCRRVNDIEAARLNGVDAVPGDVLKRSDVKEFARRLHETGQRPVFLSRGARGMLVHDAEGSHEIPGIQLLRKLDPVGAGDTALSAIACALGAGASPVEAAEFANFAAAVTVQKLYQTGTASGEEIRQMAADPNYIYQPELAEDIRQARYLDDSEIEICCAPGALRRGRITHAVFDHDGTISTLRQGWEAVMEPVMVRAILGARYGTADETLYHKVRARVREYIDQSTGVQTIVQMEALVEMVREFDLVPRDEVRDKYGYKEMYDRALAGVIGRRMAKLQRRELDVSDYTMKGAVPLLHALRERGVVLYLASGTDAEGVRAEAGALGYAGLFDGGIHGAMGDVRKFSKRRVIEEILDGQHLRGPELACFGDGPVEMRECRRHDGVAVGVAGDEIRRHGLSEGKRSRLVQAGAHLIVPDFSQADRLLQLLLPS